VAARTLEAMTLQHRPVWFRVGQLAALAGLSLLGLVDLVTGGPWHESPVSRFAALASGLLAGVAWLTSHRLDAHRLPVGAGLVAAVSMAVTLATSPADPDQGTFGLAEAAALLGLLIVVVRRSVAGWVTVAAAAVAAAVTAQPFRLPGQDTTSYLFSLFLGLLVAAAMGVGAYLRSLDDERRRHAAAVRTEQRAEFARDLHDFIAHHVTGIVVRAQGAQLVVRSDPGQTIAALEEIERAGAETMASMRRMVGVLRAMGEGAGAPVAPLQGIAALEEMVEKFSAAGGPATRLRVEGPLDDVPVEIDSSVYRVVMEALTNVRRHATDATSVEVVVRGTGHSVRVQVTDDGRTATAGRREGDPRGGFGLLGLSERVRTLGGRVEAGPGPDGGWVLEAELPLRAWPGTTAGTMDP
jgi:signal transduction histidine kinase